MKKEVKDIILDLAQIAEIDPEIALIIQELLRENAALKSKIKELLIENARLREINASLNVRVETLQNAEEVLRAQLEELSTKLMKAQTELLTAKQQYYEAIMMKGITEMAYQAMIRGLERLTEKIEEVVSKPSYQLAKEEVLNIIKDVRTEIIRIVETLKKDKVETAAVPAP